jgi:DNA-binding PadR family transcriptional regulator
MPQLRITFSTAVVLQAIEHRYRHGFDIMDASGLPDGTVYPALRRLERGGLVTSEWENKKEAHAQKRPARRYYELTAEGRRVLADAIVRYRGLDLLMAGQGPSGRRP